MREIILKVAPELFGLVETFVRPVAEVRSMKVLDGGYWEVTLRSHILDDGPPIPCRGFFYPSPLDDGMGSCILFRMVPDMPNADLADAVEEVTPEVREMLARLLSKGSRG